MKAFEHGEKVDTVVSPQHHSRALSANNPHFDSYPKGVFSMLKTKYETEVAQLGPLSQEFIAEGILVFFDMSAPEELAEFAILHEHGQLYEDFHAGDQLVIGEKALEILSVGEKANDNVAKLGHLVVKFNGQSEPEMPGDISVAKIPTPPIGPGTIIKIIAGN